MSSEYDYSLAPLRSNKTSKKNDGSQHFHSDLFRILRLFKGSPKNELAGNLKVWKLRRSTTNSFEAAAPYDALSYTWGPHVNSSCKIKIVADDNVYTLPIGRNLDTALRRLRSKDESRDLWVDAICINQADKEEKSVQIPLMRDIYNDATFVRIWLGDEENDSNEGMEFMSKCTDTEIFDSQIDNAEAIPKWVAVSALMRRPWFSRRWIIQEIALARKAVVHCGGKWLDWRDFASVIGMIAEAQPQLKTLFRESSIHKNHPDFLGDLNELGAIKLAHLADNLLLKDTDGRIDGRSLSLEALVASLTAFEASEAHDVIYAILWLADDAHPVTKYTFTNALVMDGNATPLLRTPSALALGPDVPLDFVTNSLPSPVLSTRDRPSSSGSNIHPPSRQDLTYFERHAQSTSNGIRPVLSPSMGGSHAQADNPYLGGTATGLQIIVTPTEASDTTVIHADASHLGHLIPSPRKQQFGRPRSPSIGEVSNEKDKKHVAVAMFMNRLNKSRIVVDYELSAFEVYKNFLELAFRQSKSLDILCIPWAPNDPQLPSWIPQLSKNAFGYNNRGILRRTHADPLVQRPGHSNGGSKPYRAARSLPAVYNFGGPDGRSLEVQGFVLDRIHRLGKEAVDAVIPSEWIEAVGWTDQTKAPPDVFWRTLVGNLNTAGDAYAPINWEISCKDAFKRRTKGGPLNTSDILHDCPDNVRKFLERVQRVIWSRRLVLVERHSKTSIALTPAEALEGDLICILHGCSVPVVLREMIEEQPNLSPDTLICYNCNFPNHRIQQCAQPVDMKRVYANAAKHHPLSKSANTELPASATMNPRKRKGSCPTIMSSAPSDKPRKHYKLIGECYVHRMMNGEASRALTREQRIENARKQDAVFWPTYASPMMFELR